MFYKIKQLIHCYFRKHGLIDSLDDGKTYETVKYSLLWKEDAFWMVY